MADLRARRGIEADVGDYKFVAPDNGVLSLAAEVLAKEAGKMRAEGKAQPE